MTLWIANTGPSINSNTNSEHDVILQDITISFCCFQLLCSNTLRGVHYFVFIVWFSELVCHTLFPLFGFHTEQLAAFRLLLRNKSGTRCLASLALPSCVTCDCKCTVSENPQAFCSSKKKRELRLFLKNKSGAFPVYYQYYYYYYCYYYYDY